MGWIANAIVLWGMFLIGNKSRLGFLVTVVGELMWSAVGVVRGELDLMIICLLFAGMAVRNYVKWADTNKPVDLVEAKEVSNG